MGELYNRQLVFVIRSHGREDRRARLRVTVEYEKAPGLERDRALTIRLTDENDLFFLHYLRITAQDFQLLKDRERFLIDFDTFPRHVIDFLDLCLQEEQRRPSKYIAQLLLNGVDVDAPHSSRLEIIETNEFQYITRLKLSLIPGSDADVKSHLARCLKILRQEKDQIEQKAQNMQADMCARLQNLEDTLRRKSADLEQLQGEWNDRIGALHDKYSDEITKEREKSTTTVREIQQRFEEDKKSGEVSARRTLSKLEAKNYELETVNKDLIEKKNRNEGIIQELKERLEHVENEYNQRNNEVLTCRRQLVELQGQVQEFEALKQNVQDSVQKHQEVVTRLQDRINAVQDQNEKLEKIIEQKDIKISRSQKDYQLQAMDLNKANDIIRKLQLENRTVIDKLKIRSEIVVQQESALKDTKTLLDTANSEIMQLKTRMDEKDAKISSLLSSLDSAKAEYEEAERSLENNANVISWLNRQLNVLNGKSVHALHPSTTVSTAVPNFSDLNIPAAPLSRSSGIGRDGSTRTSRTGSSRRSDSSPEELPKAINLPKLSEQRNNEPVVDEKYFQVPTTRKSGAHAPITPISALKSVSSAYFG